MTTVEDSLRSAVDRVAELAKPVSIFLYGSQARGDTVPESDFELGVVIKRGQSITRRAIAEELELISSNIRGYVFVYEDLLNKEIDTPFEKSLFLRELACSAVTLYGQHLVEELVPPPVTATDAILDLRFQVGRSIAALIASRNGEEASATENFHKSCLFGCRLLAIESAAQFPSNYADIVQLVTGHLPEEFSYLPRLALASRSDKRMPEDQAFHDNIALLTKYIEPRLYNAKHNGRNMLS